MRLRSLKYLLKQGVSGLWSNRINSFASLCVITISLMMVGISVLISININNMIGSIESRNEVTVVISDGTPENNVNLLGQQLGENPNIFEVTFCSKDEAWEGLLSSMSEEEIRDFRYIKDNPLPDSYRIRVKDISELSRTVSEISTLEFVDSVESPDDFASILVGIRNVVTVLFSAVILALIIVCFVIISNSTRTSVYARRREINIMRYVGASKSFIEIPFFIEGLLIGILSAGIAFGITWLAYAEVYSMFSTDVSMLSIFGFGAIMPFEEIALPTGLSYLGVGIFISAIGTVIAARKHLNV